MASMSSIIEELAKVISSSRRYQKFDVPKYALSGTRYDKNKISVSGKAYNLALTYASHETIVENPGPRTLSNLRTYCPERTMPQTRGDVIYRQCCGSSRGRAVTANFGYPAPTCRLPDSLSDSGQQSLHQNMTDGWTCSCCLRFAA